LGTVRLRDVWRKVVKQGREKSVLRCMMASGVEVAALVARVICNGWAEEVDMLKAMKCLFITPPENCQYQFLLPLCRDFTS
jgi:hypothetical protein